MTHPSSTRAIGGLDKYSRGYFLSTASDGDQAAKIIQNALGVENDEVANYVFPKTWPIDREQRARVIGEWFQTAARFIA